MQIEKAWSIERCGQKRKIFVRITSTALFPFSKRIKRLCVGYFQSKSSLLTDFLIFSSAFFSILDT